MTIAYVSNKKDKEGYKRMNNAFLFKGKPFMIYKLCRFHSVALMTAFIFLPIFSSGNSFIYSIIQVVPFFFLISSEIVLNDICDIEKDKINKPQRVLTTGIITKFQAKIIFLVLTGIAMCSAMIIYQRGIQIVLFLSVQVLLYFYNFPLQIIGYLKTILTAISVSLAIGFAFSYSSFNYLHIILLLISFFFILGRETLMDIRDKEGDYLNKYYTLAIYLGDKKTFYLACVYFCICIVLSIYVCLCWKNIFSIFIVMSSNIVLATLVYCFKNNNGNRKRQNDISILLWIPMLLYLLGLGGLLWI